METSENSTGKKKQFPLNVRAVPNPQTIISPHQAADLIIRHEIPIERVGLRTIRRRPKIYRQHITNFLQNPMMEGLNQNDVLEFQTTGSRYLEILAAAKSVFSKRTRTLYHWMYPDFPNQQIKQAVTEAWEKLGPQEKQFYISQVLVKFGIGQSNLMVNPQLGGITEIRPALSGSIPANSLYDLQNSRIISDPLVVVPRDTRKRLARPLANTAIAKKLFIEVDENQVYTPIRVANDQFQKDPLNFLVNYE